MAVGRWMIWGVSVIICQGWAQQFPTVGQSAPKLEIGAIEQGSVEQTLDPAPLSLSSGLHGVRLAGQPFRI
jgi:hypothetical protein